MSNHIASRWYRAPEIILNEYRYDDKVDMWGIGCLFAEMIQFTDVYRANGYQAKDRILFPG